MTMVALAHLFMTTTKQELREEMPELTLPLALEAELLQPMPSENGASIASLDAQLHITALPDDLSWTVPHALSASEIRSMIETALPGASVEVLDDTAGGSLSSASDRSSDESVVAPRGDLDERVGREREGRPVHGSQVLGHPRDGVEVPLRREKVVAHLGGGPADREYALVASEWYLTTDGIKINALPADYVPVGLLTPEGINFEREVNTETVEALGHFSPVREDITGGARRLTFTALEVLNRRVVEVSEAIDLSVGLAANGPTGDIVREATSSPIPNSNTIERAICVTRSTLFTTSAIVSPASSTSALPLLTLSTDVSISALISLIIMFHAFADRPGYLAWRCSRESLYASS